MWCSHNDVDLKPVLISLKGEDWVTVFCMDCKKRIGKRVRLVDLVNTGIKRARKKREQRGELDPDFEKPD